MFCSSLKDPSVLYTMHADILTLVHGESLLQLKKYQHYPGFDPVTEWSISVNCTTGLWIHHLYHTLSIIFRYNVRIKPQSYSLPQFVHIQSNINQIKSTAFHFLLTHNRLIRFRKIISSFIHKKPCSDTL